MTNIVVAILALVGALALVLVAVTRIGVTIVESRHPPVGAFTEAAGTRMHYVHLPLDGPAELPPIVFIHGASGNLKDQMIPARPLLEGRGELLFLDRPGHGWSQRGRGNETPAGQAATIAALMDGLGIADAIVVAHSFGSAVAASLALDHPQKVRGLVFLAAASHPWPGGETAWYYKLAARPVIGRIFAQTLALPATALAMRTGAETVFAPNPVPETYLNEVGIGLLMRPANFRANAIDVAGLNAHALATAPRYRGITAPTIVISGDSDEIVYEEIHSGGLIRDLPNAQGVWVRGLGHKPDWVAPDLTAAAIERLAGADVDFAPIVADVERRIAR